jgi:hypothetical protein
VALEDDDALEHVGQGGVDAENEEQNRAGDAEKMTRTRVITHGLPPP